MSFPSLSAALDYLYRFTDYEKMGRYQYSRTTFDLKRMRQMLAWCGNPDRSIPQLVHVAGTKGKGSTCMFTSALLRATGLRTGLYTSPHLEDVRERIIVDGKWIAEDALRDRLSSLKDYLDQPRDSLPPTFFDIFTAIAFCSFMEAGCEAAVVEVGLGGRLDSTNVIRPSVTAISSIHYDHTEKLGEKLEQIAAEKAGILKPGVPAVFANQPAAAEKILETLIRDLDIPAWWIGREIEIENHEDGSFDVVTPARRHSGLRLHALGEHQRGNAAAALAICDWLSELHGLEFEDAQARRVLSDLLLPGRIEVFGSRPAVILDGAHNAISVEALAQTIQESCNYERLFLVLGIASDKSIRPVIETLTPLADLVFATATPNPRAFQPSELAAEVHSITGTSTVEVSDPIEALERARDAAGPNDLVVVAGSFYLAGELRPILRNAHHLDKQVVVQ